jgi:hypothetical protein
VLKAFRTWYWAGLESQRDGWTVVAFPWYKRALQSIDTWVSVRLYGRPWT